MKAKETIVLSEAFIDALPHTCEKIIENYQRKISKELVTLSKELAHNGEPDFHNKARAKINKKYGKFWRERLNMKKIYKRWPFGKMSYY